MTGQADSILKTAPPGGAGGTVNRQMGGAGRGAELPFANAAVILGRWNKCLKVSM